jgi:zinc protease
MFQLIHLYFTQPRRDDQAYQSLMTRQKQILANLLVDPNYYFRDRVTNLKYNNHIRRGIPTVEDLESVSLDRIMEVYRDRFADASDFTFTFVGNFTEEDIRPLIEQYIATLPSIDREETWKDVGADIVTGKHIERFDYGKAPKSQIEMTWSGMFDWDDRESRYHFNALLEVLRNKLRESMREDQGGVYGVRVAGGVSRYPKEDYNVTISFNAEPEEVDTLIQIAKRDIAAVMESGAEAEEIQKVVEIQRQSRITELKENGFWSNSLRTYYRYDLDPKLLLLENYDPLLESLTGDDIQRMANRIFDTENYLEVVMMPAEGEGE